MACKSILKQVCILRLFSTMNGLKPTAIGTLSNDRILLWFVLSRTHHYTLQVSKVDITALLLVQSPANKEAEVFSFQEPNLMNSV